MSFDQSFVITALLKELRVGTTLNDEALLEDNNFISILDCRESMRDNNNSLTEFSVLQDLIKGLLDLVLRLSIQSTSCFVEEKDFGLSNQCSSDRNSLLLASRELDTSLTNKGIIA